MTESEYRTFIAARYVASVVLRYLQKTKTALNDNRHFPILPECNQLRFGLCLRLERCGSSILNSSFSLWTPWGTWYFCDAHPKVRELPLTMEGLRLLQVDEESTLHQPTTGRIYAVHEAAKLVMSYPKRRPTDKFLDEETAQRKWNEISMRYFEGRTQD